MNMLKSNTAVARGNEWFETPAGDPRGYIDPHALDELWFHTGTACNLSCPFCLEGSKPGDTRLGIVRFDEIRPFIDEAVELGVKQFSFTGGEPFVAKDLIRILDYALDHRPCLVLTNGTKPLLRRMKHLAPLLDKPNALHFRISLDHFDPVEHDKQRGVGSFELALQGLKELYDAGFNVSIASHTFEGMPDEEVVEAFASLMRRFELPEDLTRIAFPEFHNPGASPTVPQVSENCMTTYHTAETRRSFMCAFSKMVIKTEGRMRVYACTLVDDDPEYDLGGSLREALQERVSMKHHRCYSCFAFGASCSEM